MVSPTLEMTYQEKQRRAKFKRKTLLNFLASGEVYTILSIVAELLETSERNALRLLQSMAQEKLIKVDEGIVPHSNLKLWGITGHGLAMSESAHPACREFELGKTNPGWVTHHVECQHIRIVAERNGWTGWVPGKLLHLKNGQGLKKIPDFLMTRPQVPGSNSAVTYKACGELERYCKSPTRLSIAMGGHLMNVVSGHYDFIYYFVYDKAAQERAFNRVKFLIVDGKKVLLNDSHRSRFKVYEIDTWKGEM